MLLCCMLLLSHASRLSIAVVEHSAVHDTHTHTRTRTPTISHIHTYRPNGGLIYCMEFLIANLQAFDDALGHYEDDYIIFDCPGQIELYTHIPVRCYVASCCRMLSVCVCVCVIVTPRYSFCILEVA